jgi:hypothetical protein
MIMMIQLLEIAVGCYLSEIKPKLKRLVFKPAAMTSAPVWALTGVRAKTGAIEAVAANAAATAFCTMNVASFRNNKELALPFEGVVVAIVVATAPCARVATITQNAGL